MVGSVQNDIRIGFTSLTLLQCLDLYHVFSLCILGLRHRYHCCESYLHFLGSDCTLTLRTIDTYRQQVQRFFYNQNFGFGYQLML